MEGGSLGEGERERGREGEGGANLKGEREAYCVHGRRRAEQEGMRCEGRKRGGLQLARTDLAQTQACSSTSSSRSDIIEAVRESEVHANGTRRQANIQKAVNAPGERQPSKKRS